MSNSSSHYKNLEAISPGITLASDVNTIGRLLEKSKTLGLIDIDFAVEAINGANKLNDLLESLEKTAAKRVAIARELIGYDPDDHFPDLLEDIGSAPDQLRQLFESIDEPDGLEYSQLAELQNNVNAIGYQFDYDLGGMVGPVRAKKITPEEAKAAFLSYGKDVQWTLDRMMESAAVQSAITNVRNLIDNAQGTIAIEDFDGHMVSLSEAIYDMAERCGITKSTEPVAAPNSTRDNDSSPSPF